MRVEIFDGLHGGRRELRLRIGTFTVIVVEIPGRSLSDREWHEIRRARGSYFAMWGGHDPDSDDPSDGWGPPYRTWHYLGRVTGGGCPPKLVVMRKVTLASDELTADQRAEPGDLLPLDIRFWKVHTDVGSMPLWDALKEHVRRLAPYEEHPEFRIASISRLAALPCREEQRSIGERERTALAFAAIQLLATHGDPSLLLVCTLRPELRDRIVGVRDVRGSYVAPAFTTTEETLGLPPGSVRLDNSSTIVQEYKTTYPGYFVDNDDAARFLARFLGERQISVADLRPAIVNLVANEWGSHRRSPSVVELLDLVGTPDHRRIAEVLTAPRMFKYLRRLVSGDGQATAISGRELRERFLAETADGPFSATIRPEDWAASALAVLTAADRR